MIGAKWFWYGTRWHALKVGHTSHSECGVRLIDDPPTVTATAGSPAPPLPCRICLVSVGLRGVLDEPMGDAMARGFAPPPSDLE